MTTPAPPPGFVLVDGAAGRQSTPAVPPPPPGFELVAAVGAIDFDGPDDQVRAAIGKLSGEERRRALDQWADRFVARERSQGGFGQRVDDTVRTLARGTFVGPFLDEITAGTQKAMQVVSGGRAGSDYDEALAYQRAQDRAVDNSAPVLSTVGKVVGGVAGAGAAMKAGGAAGVALGGPLAQVTPAATLPGQIAQGAGIGAAYGAAAGFGNAEGGEGSLVDQAASRAGDAARGAVFGGVVGGTLPPVVAGVSSAAAAVSDAVTPSLARWSQQLTNVLESAGIRTGRQPTSAGAMASGPAPQASPVEAAADQVIANQLSRAGRSVTDLRQALAQANEARTFRPGSQAQDVLAPVDLDPSLQRLASSAARQQPEAGNIAASFITARQKGETPPVPLHAAAGIPTKPKMAPVDPDAPPIGQYERVKDAMRRAFGINSASTHGFGNTAARVEERLIERARKEAKNLYAAAYKAGSGVDLGPTVAPVVSKWRAAAVDETEDVAKVFEKFSSWVERAVAPAGVKHHIERFDKAKQLMDDEIDKAFRAGDRYLGGQMTQFKNELLGAVDGVAANKMGEAYAKARDAFSSRMEMRDALELGRKLFTENADVAVDQFRGLSAGQAKMARIGIVDSFERRMAGQKRAADITQVFETPRVQEILEAMIPRSRATKANPNPEFANRPERFGAYLANEQRMIGTRDEVLGNSKTAQRLADDKSMNSMVDMLDDIKRAGTSPTAATMQFVANQLDRIFGFRADTAAEVARKLFTANPGERDRVLSAVEKRLGPDRAAQFRNLMSDYHGRIMQVGANATSASVQTPPGQSPVPQPYTPPDPKPMPPPMRLGGPAPADSGEAPADLAGIGIDAGRRSDRGRMRDTVSQVEPDNSGTPVEHYSRRMNRTPGGQFAPGKPRAAEQRPSDAGARRTTVRDYQPHEPAPGEEAGVLEAMGVVGIPGLAMATRAMRAAPRSAAASLAAVGITASPSAANDPAAEAAAERRADAGEPLSAAEIALYGVGGAAAAAAAYKGGRAIAGRLTARGEAAAAREAEALTRVKTEIGRLEDGMRRVGMDLPPRPMPVGAQSPATELADSVDYLRQLQAVQPSVELSRTRALEAYQAAIKPPGRAIGEDRGAVDAAVRSGQMIPRRGGAVVPQADPARAAAASREATAIEQGRFRMERQAAAAAEQASPTVSRQLNDARIEEVAQRALGVVANRIGSTAPDQLAALPRGVYERFLANEPALAMVMREYGLGIDDVVAAMQRRGFALQPFNGNVMQQYQPGRSGALPMTAEEKALRDAIHRRQKSLDRQNYDR